MKWKIIYKISGSIFWHEIFLPLVTSQPVPSCAGVERHLQACAPQSRDGVRGLPLPVVARRRYRCAERGLRQAGCVAARPAAGCSRRQSFICCGPTIPQVWPGMSSAGLEVRRAGAEGMRSVLSGRRGSGEIRFTIGGGRPKADHVGF